MGSDSPQRIVIASLLKPVDDPRMYNKMARTLAAMGHQVHLIGAASERVELAACADHCPPGHIHFQPIGTYGRSLGQRMARIGDYLRLLGHLRPSVIICNTPELLWPTLLAKWASPHRTLRLIYDVRENYFLNLAHQQVYPGWKKKLLALLVRGIEVLSYPWMNQLLLAESTYWDEMPFVRGKAVVLENKFAGLAPLPRPHFYRPGQHLRLLYSGTITRHYGTVEALHFFRQFHRAYSNSSLQIIGHCSDPLYWQEVRAASRGLGTVELAISPTPVPHSAILSAIQTADLALLAYLPNRSTANCVPARLYEYLAHSLPMLVPANPLWTRLLAQSEAGFAIDYAQADCGLLLAQLFATEFYPAGPPALAFWGMEEKEILAKAIYRG